MLLVTITMILKLVIAFGYNVADYTLNVYYLLTKRKASTLITLAYRHHV